MRRPAQYPDDVFDNGLFEDVEDRGKPRNGPRRWLTVRDAFYQGHNQYELGVYSECWDVCDREHMGSFQTAVSEDVEDATWDDGHMAVVNVTNSSVYDCYRQCQEEDRLEPLREWPEFLKANFSGRARLSGLLGKWHNLEVAFQMTKVRCVLTALIP